MRIACVLAAIAGSLLAGPAALAETKPGVAKSSNQFAADLYKQLAKDDQGNLFFSPISISAALSMTLAGARGETADEMVRTLQLPSADAQVHQQFGRLLKEWNTPPKEQEYELQVANRLWGQKDYAFQQPFVKLTRDVYGAELAQVDFIARTEPSRAAINRWVQQQTNQKIKNLIPQGMLSSDTRLVLTNAIYFKASWMAPFEKSATREAAFHVAPNKQTKVPMMHKHARQGYARVHGAQVVELTYKSGLLAMTIVLPDKVDGLAELEQKLTADQIAAWREKLAHRSVDLAMPRFKLETDYNLKPPLEALGMQAAFDAKTADFSGIATQEDLFITDAVHKAMVDVNEQGTEAAGATGVVAGITSAPVEPDPIVRVDHPFLFMITDVANGSVLFIGRVTNPAN